MDDMVEFYQEHGPSCGLQSFDEDNDAITIIQLRKDARNSSIGFEKFTLSGLPRDNWIASHIDRHDRDVVLQLLQITMTRDLDSGRYRGNISSHSFKAIVEKFGIEHLVTYGASAIQLVSHSLEASLDQRSDDSVTNVDEYFTQAHKVHHSTNVTQGIYWGGARVVPFLEGAIRCQKALAQHPYFLRICINTAFGVASDLRAFTIRDEIACVERRTGFKVWELSRYNPAQGDFHTLTAQLSGYGTSLAANKRLNQLTEKILKSCDIDCLHDTTHTRNQNDGKIVARIDLLMQRTESQRILLEFLTVRLQNQLTALFNLVTQTDTKLAISLAQDSRTIAEASKHDSSSMKTLAAVTVVFLPGTFISSLFSISMFDWQADAHSTVLNQRFWVYWAVTIPLTLFTIIAWSVWTKIDLSSYQKHEARSREKSLSDVDLPAT